MVLKRSHFWQGIQNYLRIFSILKITEVTSILGSGSRGLKCHKICVRYISIKVWIFCTQKKPFLTRNPKLLADLFYLKNYGSYVHFEVWFTRFEMSQNLRSLNFDKSMDFLYSKEAIFDKESKTTCRSFLSWKLRKLRPF